MSPATLVLPANDSLDTRVEGILRNGVPEILQDRSGVEHNIELLTLPKVHRPAVRDTADSAFQANLVLHYFHDKADADFFVERDGDNPIYKTEIIALPQWWGRYMDILATHTLARRNGSAKAAVRAFLSSTEGAAWRSREDRKVNWFLYEPLVNQLRQLGIPAESRPLPYSINGHNYFLYAVNLTGSQIRDAEHLAQTKAPNFTNGELSEYQLALHDAHYQVARALQEETALLSNPAQRNAALRRASLARRIACNLLGFPQSEHSGMIITSYNVGGTASLFNSPVENIIANDLPYVARRVAAVLPPEMRNGGIKGYNIVKAA